MRPYCIKGYELQEDSYDAVKQAQEYLDAGKVNVALEFRLLSKEPTVSISVLSWQQARQ